MQTGQHFDAAMSDVFFAKLDTLKPDYFFGIHGGGHRAMSARILTDRITRWLFTPTQTAAHHLHRDRFNPEQIHPVGDVRYYVALHRGPRVQASPGLLARLDLQPKGYVLATVHSAENADHPDRLAAIVDALIATAQQLHVVWPLHPRTRTVLQRVGKLDAMAARVKLLDPVEHQDMLQLEKFSARIITNSGGVRKESLFYQVPYVTLCDETERVKLVEGVRNRLASLVSAGAFAKSILRALGSQRLVEQPCGECEVEQRVADQLASELQV